VLHHVRGQDAAAEHIERPDQREAQREHRAGEAACAPCLDAAAAPRTAPQARETEAIDHESEQHRQDDVEIEAEGPPQIDRTVRFAGMSERRGRR
jgi:hypothetical protein